MMDVEKHVQHWLTLAQESQKDAELLLANKRWNFGAFSIHLAVEKLLKAHVTRATRDVPPKVHNLLYLAKLSGLTFTPEQLLVFARINEYQLEGRYRDIGTTSPSPEIVQEDMRAAKELMQWLTKQL